MINFNIGNVTVFPNAAKILSENEVSEFLARHVAGDCQILDAEIIGIGNERGDFGRVIQSRFYTYGGIEVLVFTYLDAGSTYVYLLSDV